MEEPLERTVKSVAEGANPAHVQGETLRQKDRGVESYTPTFTLSFGGLSYSAASYCYVGLLWILDLLPFPLLLISCFIKGKS